MYQMNTKALTKAIDRIENNMDKTTGYEKLGKRYGARIKKKGVDIRLGMFNTKEEAMAVAKKERKKYLAELKIRLHLEELFSMDD